MAKRWLLLGLGALGLSPLAAQQAAPSPPRWVFFDWGKPEINGDAAIGLDAVARAFRPGEHIRLEGHSDRSGPAGANRRSALKRAEAACDYLAQHGVAASAMSVMSYGEERPLVPTEDGVREPQNRRVEIIVKGGGA